MGQFDLEAHSNEIGALLIGYIDDKATRQIIQNIGRYRVVLFNSIRIGIHCGAVANCRHLLAWLVDVQYFLFRFVHKGNGPGIDFRSVKMQLKWEIRKQNKMIRVGPARISWNLFSNFPFNQYLVIVVAESAPVQCTAMASTKFHTYIIHEIHSKSTARVAPIFACNEQNIKQMQNKT